MAELLKVGGSTDNGTASGIALGNFGAVKTVQYPNKGFFLGSVLEPVSDGFVGSYGVFGLEAIATYPIRPLDAYSNCNFADARNGHVAYIAKTDEGAFLNFVNMSGSISWSRKLRALAVEWVCAYITPTTVIAVSHNSAFSVYDIKTAQLVHTGALPVVADLTSKVLGTWIAQDDSNVYFVTVKGISKCSFDMKTVVGRTWQEISPSYPVDNAVHGVAVHGNNLLVTTWVSPSRILCIAKSGLTLVSETNSGGLGISSFAPIVFSVGADLYGVSNDNLVYKLKVTAGVITVDSVTEIPGLSINMTNRIRIAASPDGLVLVSSPTANTLFSATSGRLLWTLANTVRFFGCFAAFDGFGHCIFNYGGDKLAVVGNFLQVQGYGVRS